MMPEPRATTTSGPCAEVWAHAPSGAGAQSTILHSTRFWAGHMLRWFSFTCEKVLPFHWFLYSTHIPWVLVPGVVGDVTTGCSPFPLGPCDCFPGGLHAFRLEPPACWGLAYLQPAVPTVGQGSALSPLQTGRLSWSFLLEQKRMVRKRQGWPWQKETGKSSGSERPSFQTPLPAPTSSPLWTWLQRGQGARAPSLAPCSSRAQHLPGISQGTCSREGPSSESSAAERRPCKNNSKDEAHPAVTLFTIQRTKS